MHTANSLPQVPLVPGVLVLIRDDTCGHHRLWQVLSCCQGGPRQESLVELRSLTELPGIDEDGERHDTTWVPKVPLRGTERFMTAAFVVPDPLLDALRKQVAVACQDGNWNANRYMRGIANCRRLQDFGRRP